MSKKILAIALFAVMVLSLVPSVGAVVNLTSVTVEGLESADGVVGDYAGAGGTMDGNFATVVSGLTDAKTGNVSYSTSDGAFATGVSGVSDTMTIRGNWDNMYKGPAKEYSAALVPVFKFTIAIGAYDADAEYLLNGLSIKGDLAKVGGGPLAHGDAAEYVGYFAAEKGGNSQTYTYIARTSGTTNTKTFTIKYENTATTGKPERSLDLTVRARADGTDASTINNIDTSAAGDYNARIIGGVLFIDVAQDLLTSSARTIPLDLKFQSSGSLVPVKDELAEWQTHGDNKAVLTVGTDKAIKHDKWYRVSMTVTDATTHALLNQVTLGVQIEDRGAVYKMTIPVKFRALPRNEITNIAYESNMTLAVGEEKSITLSDLNLTTFNTNDVRITELKATPIVYLDGLKVKGLSVGTTTLLVETLQAVPVGATPAWKSIGTINVTVNAAGTVAPSSSYRVIARTLNVRSGPGTGYGIVRTTSMNSILSVDSIANGWAKLSDGTYVSAQYIVAVNVAGAIGNYTVTASTLNVRSTPNGAIVGTLAKGTPVTIVALSNSWGQLSTGNWISMLYVK